MSAVASAPGWNVESGGWPANGNAEVIVLLFASIRAERSVLEAWVRENQPPEAHVRVLDASDSRLEAELGSGADPCVSPIRVAWLPGERPESRAGHVRELLTVPDLPRPLRYLRDRITGRHPERRQVLVAEPARESNLRERFDRERGGSGDFADFVRQQAVLALDRAERSVIGMQYKVPRFVSEELTASPRFQSGVARLCDGLDKSEADVAVEAGGYIDEMVASRSELAIDAWGEFGRWLARAYTIEVDEARLDELRALGARHPLAFLPSHRSYLDPLVIRAALREHDFPPNHVLGGINVGFWPIGPVARRSGYVFIRRSFRDNPVYKFALRQYIAYLLRKRFNLEWYIEGGRSRTGKLRPPRYGLLSYVVDAYRDGGVEDVQLVPCSIVYDQLYEVGAMAAEEHGAKKSSEGIGWLVGYARAQGRRLGKVRVGFGEPVSLREALEPSDGGDPRNAVEKVAFEVCHNINRATPLTPTGLVSLALLGVEDRALTLAEVRSILDPLLDYVERRALPLSAGVDLRDDAVVRSALDALAQQGVVRCFGDGLEPVWAIGPERHLEAAFYRNAAVHFFVNRAIAELVLARAAEERGPALRDEGWAEALRLRDLLKFEFFFARKRDFAEEIREEMAIFDRDWEERPSDPEEPREMLWGSPLHLAHRVLRPFLEAYAVVADRLAAREPAAEVDEKAFLAECTNVAHQYRLQQRLHSAESISRELFRTALKLASNRGLVEPGGEELAAHRRAFADEVHGEVKRVSLVRDLALEGLDPSESAR